MFNYTSVRLGLGPKVLQYKHIFLRTQGQYILVVTVKTWMLTLFPVMCSWEYTGDWTKQQVEWPATLKCWNTFLLLAQAYTRRTLLSAPPFAGATSLMTLKQYRLWMPSEKGWALWLRLGITHASRLEQDELRPRRGRVTWVPLSLSAFSCLSLTSSSSLPSVNYPVLLPACP